MPFNPSCHPGSDIARVLLIDLENCPNQINQLQKDLEYFSQVIICYAQSGAKIPLDWLIPLSTAVSTNKLMIFKMTNSGKNAADFGICFFAGVLMQQLQQNTHFVIISNDTDLDHVVNLLKSQGRSAERVGTEKEEKPAINTTTAITIPTTTTPTTTTPTTTTPTTTTPTTTTPTTTTPLSLSPIKIYCMHLVTYSKNRPAKKDALLNSIKNKFKDTPKVAAEVLKTLTAQGAVTFLENKVFYNDKKIKEIASSA